MSKLFVQFDGEAQSVVVAEFRCVQDLEYYPHQGEVDSDDPRYVAFLGVQKPVGEGDQAVVTDAETGRIWRNAEIARVSWIRDRHRDELDLGAATSISADWFVELLGYIQKLRDWPQSSGFPNPSGRPLIPEWINTQ